MQGKFEPEQRPPKMKRPSLVKAFYGTRDLWTRFIANDLKNGAVYQITKGVTESPALASR